MYNNFVILKFSGYISNSILRLIPLRLSFPDTEKRHFAHLHVHVASTLHVELSYVCTCTFLYTVHVRIAYLYASTHAHVCSVRARRAYAYVHMYYSIVQVDVRSFSSKNNNFEPPIR